MFIYKKIFIITILPLMLLTAVPAVAATINSISQTGLVGWWTFDTEDVVGTSVRDRSPSKNNATLVNSPTISAGKFGTSLRTPSGSSSYADAGTKNLTFTTAFSTSFWAYPEQLAAWKIILGKEIWNNGQGFLIWTSDSSGTLSYTVPSGGVTLSNAFALNTWTHITITNDNGSVKIYKNGVEATTGSAAITNAAVNLFIGARHPNDGSAGFADNWVGKIDDVRVYNRVLYPSEVQQIYRFGATSKVNQPKTTDSLTRGQIAWWTFDAPDTTTSTVYDRSGNGNNATKTATTLTLGKFGQGVKSAGNSDSVAAIVSGLPSGNSARTISAWFKPTTDNDIVLAGIIGYPYASYGGGTGRWFEIKYSDAGDDKFGFHLYNTHYLSTNTFPINNWYHLVATYSGTNLRLYVNNSLEINQTGVSLNTDVNPTGYNFNVLGRVNKNVDSVRPGIIDDVRIWNRALSVTEVAQLYSLGQGTINNSAAVRPANGGLIGWWTFDGQDLYPASASDKSVSGLTLTRTGATPAKGRLGQGITLGADTDNFVTASNSILDTDTHTIAFWMRLNSLPSGWRTIFSYTPGGDDRSPGIWIVDGSRCIHWRYNPGNAGVSCGGPTGESTYFTFGKWYYIAGVKNGSSLKFYVDGVQQIDAAVPATKTAGSAVITIGKNSWYSAPFATLDDVRVWNRSLSATEIKQLYNGTK